MLPFCEKSYQVLKRVNVENFGVAAAGVEWIKGTPYRAHEGGVWRVGGGMVPGSVGIPCIIDGKLIKMTRYVYIHMDMLYFPDVPVVMNQRFGGTCWES